MTPRGERYVLWRAVDEYGIELDILLAPAACFAVSQTACRAIRDVASLY